ncbi:MAG TPA: DUF2868 domain-containing protein [Candidatus Aphodousia gallistercoris]|nr:DUF2868 domain-containing protein [Candidatus Aphodousia gallistercoris]
MTGSSSSLSTGRFSLSDVEHIARARLLEQTPTLSWELSDANRATRQAAIATGESATIAAFLLARARIVEKMIAAKNPQVRTDPLRLTPPWWLTAVLAAAAFLLGLLLDQLGSTDARINLLSLPFFGVLLWNIVVYVMLFISGLRHGEKRDFLHLRAALELLEKTVIAKQIRKTQIMSAVLEPLTLHYAARAFHLAALTFVLGMIVSVLLRGVGTAYTVGWESTWFAESPEIVYQIIALVYGIFTNFLGPMPNILDVANMRFDRLAVNGYEASAGLWLMRMIVMLCFFVVIPRALLVLKHTVQIAQLKKHFPLDLDDRYYSAILRTWRTEAMNLDLLVPETQMSQPSIEGAYRLAETLGFNLSDVRTHAWNTEEATVPMTLEIKGQSQQVWLLISGTTTPEPEVQGQAIEEIKKKVGKTPVILLVDMAAYMVRFGDFGERIENRKDLWRDFAQSVGLAVVFFHSGLQPDEKTCDELKLAAHQVA